MGRRKINKENIRKIQSSKGSYYITIPIQIMRSLKWKERQKVVVEKSGSQKITIVDWK
ncbi:hypothetical protein KKD04_03210 [Patescibacteria group bacterium]|nr:hypothetical protein [Patescibacteria group bacterium]